MSKEKNTDKLFREKLHGFEQEPPAYVLDNVLAGMAGTKRNRKVIFWRMAGVAAALLLVFITGWEVRELQLTKIFNQTAEVNQVSEPETESNSATKPEDSNQNNRLTEHVSSDESGNNAGIISGKKNNNSFIPKISKSENQLRNNSESNLFANSDQVKRLNLLKRISGVIESGSDFSESLQAKNTLENQDVWLEKSIDQQIMEQNRKIVLADNAEKLKGRWLLGAQLSPGVSVSRSSHTDQYASNMIQSSASNPVDLGGGISVEYKSGKRWSIQSGVYYSGLAQNSGQSSRSGRKDVEYANFAPGAEYLNPSVNVDALSNNLQLNSTAGVIELKSIPSQLVLGTNLEDKSLASSVIVSNAQFTQNFDYIEIPLYLRYTLIDARFDVEMLGGFSSNLLVGNQTYLEDSSGKSLVGKTNDMQAINYSGTLGIGLKYSLSKNLFLNVEPRVKYYLNSLNNNSSVTYKPYTIGIYTGVSYQF